MFNFSFVILFPYFLTCHIKEWSLQAMFYKYLTIIVTYVVVISVTPIFLTKKLKVREAEFNRVTSIVSVKAGMKHQLFWNPNSLSTSVSTTD